jgi:hypothetical protein
MKSERLQKLEMELEVNESCMAAGLFPPREKGRYLEEIRSIKTKIEEEKERLRFMKENGDVEEYVIPKRNLARQAYAEPHTLPDMDAGDQMTDNGDTDNMDFDATETGADEETESGSDSEDKETEDDDDEDEGGFSDAVRIRRLSQSQDPDRYWDE